MRPLACLCLLAFALLLAGCRFGGTQIAMPDYVMASYEGNYDESIRLVEQRLASGKPAQTRYYQHLCSAYLNAKQYDRLFPCIETFEKRMAQQGPYVFEGGDFDAHHVGTDYGFLPNELRAEAFLDLSRPEDSRRYAGLAEKYLTGPDPLKELNKPGLWVSKSDPYCFLYRPYEVQGLACAARKDAACLDRYIALLRDYKAPGAASAYAGDAIDPHRLSLARLLMAKGDYQGALDALASTDDVQGQRDLFALFGGSAQYEHELLPRQFMAGHALLMLGRDADAAQLLTPLLDNPAVQTMGNIRWMLLQDVARIERRRKQADKAVAHLAQAIDILESQRSTLRTEAMKIGFVGDKQSVYRDVIGLLVEQGRAEAAFEYAERAKSRTLVDLLAERQNFAPAAPGQDPAQTLMQLASLERSYSRETRRPEAESARLRSALGAARQSLRQSAPELASLVSVSAASARQVQGFLAPDETLLEYYLAGDEAFVFAVTREGVRAQRLDGRGLEREVRAFRDALREYGREGYRNFARSLFERLVAPVAGALERPRLLIVAHGPLHYLPWSALHDGQGFLIDRVSLRQLPSASVMQYLAVRRSSARQDMLLLGNPDLGDPGLDLPGAEAEARAIKGIWPGATVLTRKSASKAALSRGGGLYRMIHLAAHGLFASDQPLDSRILLSPEGADDGRLTAGDMYGLRLDADLVTLSACETGMGAVLSGDDVVGLTRGFLYAGAGNIVASLWPVSDAETTLLMASFYKNLKQMSKADALRQAQLETKARYPHPFYWSAFQLTGLGR